jgi:hypothetical protein
MILPEIILQAKELDQGEAYFQLQHMLNTTLQDGMRFPLKPEKLVLLSTDQERMPLTIVRGMTEDLMVERSVADFPFRLALPHELSKETALFQSVWGYVDPAPGGANADETAYAIGGFLNGNVILLACGGIPGGYELEKLEALAQVFKAYPKLSGITIEKNMGFGAFREVWTPVLRQHVQNCQIEDDLVTGQKELRIINTLSPLIGRGGLIIDESVIAEDRARCAVYSNALQQTYSLFYQLAKLSATRNALIHDDRADALEGLVRHFQAAIAQDQAKGLARTRALAHAEAIKDPVGHQRYSMKGPQSGFGSMLRRRR